MLRQCRAVCPVTAEVSALSTSSALGMCSGFAAAFGQESCCQVFPSNGVTLVVCHRDHVPQVLRLLGRVSDRLRRLPVLLLSWQGELRLHQLLQHSPLQWTPAQEEGQFCCGAEGTHDNHSSAPYVCSVVFLLLNFKQVGLVVFFTPDIICPASFFLQRRCNYFLFVSKSLSRAREVQWLCEEKGLILFVS